MNQEALDRAIEAYHTNTRPDKNRVPRIEAERIEDAIKAYIEADRERALFCLEAGLDTVNHYAASDREMAEHLWRLVHVSA